MSQFHPFDDDAALAFALAIARYAADYELGQAQSTKGKGNVSQA